MALDSTVNRGPQGAVIFYSPDLGRLDPFTLLTEQGVECRPLLDPGVNADETKPTLYLISVPFWLGQPEDHRRALLKSMRAAYGAAIVLGEAGQCLPTELQVEEVLAAWLEEPIATPILRAAVAIGLRSTRLGLSLAESRREARDSTHAMAELHRTGMALSSEKDLHLLQHLIVRTSMAVTHADAGTLYVIETKDGGERYLRFCVAQNDSIDAAYEQEVLALDKHSVAGHVACTGESLVLDDVYRLPADVEYEFNPAFDRAFGYLTRSMMVTPMINYEGAVVGVIQLINRKRDAAATLKDVAIHEAQVQPFTRRDERMLSYLGGQAAVALENRMLLETNRLYKELQGAYGRLEEYLGEVSKVITAASEVETGTFHPETLAGVAGREDALGHLGRVFQRMAAEVSAREERLRQQVTALHIEIDQSKRERQVAEITESDAFFQLQEKARALRQKR